LGADYTINTGDLDNGRFGTTLSVTSTSSATFIANNFEIRGDATNETFTHMDQGIVIHGVNYSVLFDDLIAYTDDNTDDTYTFAAIDVDLNSDGTAGNGEDGVYLVQVSGPAVPNGANLTFSSLLDSNPAPFDLVGFDVGGNDTLEGGEGDDLIDGGAGDDFLTTGLGQDTLLGRSGNDTLMNSDGDDSLDGGAGDDSIVATGDEDTLRGGTGADTMEGGADADTFIIEDNFGNDVITGGEGTTDPTDVDFDTVDLSAVSGPITVSFSQNEAGSITDNNDTIKFTEIERIFTTDSNDSIDASGDATGLVLNARGGDDTIKGGQGGDTILAGAGSGDISDGEGNDSVDGGAGDDTISGGLGKELITGGAGDDRFVNTVGNGSDTITDFNAGNSGAIGDGDGTNSDFIDLSSFL